MKQVTIENVKARIAELVYLEATEHLTLRAEFELACLRELLSSLESKPVVYSLIFRNMEGKLNDHVNANTTFETLEKAQEYGKGGRYARQDDGSIKWVADPSLDPVVVPLYRHAQPAKGLELAGWQFKSVNGDWLGLIDEHGKNQAVRDGYEVREVFAMADGVNDRDQVRREHAEWSQATFGNVGPVGPLKHLSKEALEAAAEPGDLSEWADMQFLMWDAQRRAGITDEQITQAMIDKLAVNKARTWPEPKDGEPRLHVKPENDNTAQQLESLAENTEPCVICGVVSSHPHGWHYCHVPKEDTSK